MGDYGFGHLGISYFYGGGAELRIDGGPDGGCKDGSGYSYPYGAIAVHVAYGPSGRAPDSVSVLAESSDLCHVGVRECMLRVANDIVEACVPYLAHEVEALRYDLAYFPWSYPAGAWFVMRGARNSNSVAYTILRLCGQETAMFSAPSRLDLPSPPYIYPGYGYLLV